MSHPSGGVLRVHTNDDVTLKVRFAKLASSVEGGCQLRCFVVFVVVAAATLPHVVLERDPQP